MLNSSVTSSAVSVRPTLVMQDISKAYGATIAVRSVSFDIEPGEIHAILGENGAGKSTIVKVLSGIVTPDKGVLKLDGADFTPVIPWMPARPAFPPLSGAQPAAEPHGGAESDAASSDQGNARSQLGARQP